MTERKILIRNIKYFEYSKMQDGLYVALVVGDDDMTVEDFKKENNDRNN